MKAYIIFPAVLLVLTLCTTGCTHTEEMPEGDITTITMRSPVIENVVSRAYFTGSAFSVTNGVVIPIGLGLMQPSMTNKDGATLPGYHNICATFSANGTSLSDPKYTLGGSAIEVPAVRKSAKLDIYAYYPHNDTVTNLREIPFSVDPAPDTPLGSSGASGAFPVDYMYAVPKDNSQSWSGVSASDIKVIEPEFRHTMALFRLVLSTKGTGNLTVSRVEITYKGSTGSMLSGIPLNGTYSAVDGTVSVKKRIQAIEYNYAPRSINTSATAAANIFGYIFPEMLLNAANESSNDKYPNDAQLEFTVWVNNTPTKLNGTYVLPLNTLKTGGIGLVKGYRYDLNLVISNYLQIETTQVVVAPWGDEDIELDM